MGSQLLQEWCRSQCESYPNVEIRDLTTSFKDGLAFCAIIHKHRPDLLDFHSLSKDNGYENNRLAFEVAETHFGIPALLDPADLVSAEVPDRLSVITYLSQYLTYFGKTSDDGFSSFLMSSLPSSCKAEKKAHQISEVVDQTKTSAEKKKELPSRKAPAHLCSACQKHVHLVQRHIVDGKIYHRSCFKCSQCSSTLFAGSYTKGETGSLICSHLCIQKPDGHPKVDSLADSGESLKGVPSCSTSLNEKHILEVDKEKRKESQLLESTNGDQQCVKSSGRVESEKTTVLVKQVGKTEGKQNLEKEKLIDVDTKRCGVSAGTGSSLTLAGQSGTNSRPVPAPRRAKARQQETSTSNPPWPSTKAHPAKVMKRSMSENQEGKSVLNPGEETSTLSKSSEQSSESQRTKSPPWLDLIHPGPWTKLPPVPLPPQPSRSCSVPFLSEMWSRRKAVHLTPPNPFDEEDHCEDRQGSPRDTWTACSERDESQVEITMVTSQTWCGTSGQDQANLEKSANDTQTSYASAPQSAKCSDAAPVSKVESISEGKGLKCSTEDSIAPVNCPLPQATGPNMSKTDLLEKSPAEPNGTANVAQPTGSSGVSDLAETAGSVCLLNLAEVVTVPVASRLDSSAGTTELESLPKSALASSPHTVSESDVCKEQKLIKSLSEVQLSTTDFQNILSPNITPSSPSASCSDRNTVDHSQPAHQLLCDGLFKDKEPVPPPTKPNRNKRTCKENPFNRAATLAEIPSCTAPSSSSTKAAAPGHGFPLIKRKVQTDRFIPRKDLQTERGELERRLDGLEKRGVELEKSLRDCHNEKEDDLLVNWFKLIHEKHMLVRRDAELVYMAKLQNLEERQSDVEYELRCLFNKPEKAWSKEDKAREKQLMSDLVIIIEQRNQIINSLDQDRQREQEEDMLLEDMIKKRDFLRNTENDQKIFGGKFKPMKILKQLSHKTESKKGQSKSSLKKKS